MTQTLVALCLVVAAAGWIGWTYMPRRLRKKLTGGKGGCGSNCHCGD